MYESGRNTPINYGVPTSFSNALSYEEQLHCLENSVRMLQEIVEKQGVIDENLTKQIEEMKKEIKIIQDGRDIPDHSIKLIKLHQEVITYIQKISADSVKDVAKFLSFGLTDDGHFEVIIPENWSEVSFDTTPEGNLVLNF